MNPERFQPYTTPEHGPKKLESIFKYYSVPNEIRFVNNLEAQHFPRTDTRYYVRENVYRFLGEFAGKIPYAKLSFMQGQNDIEYAGMELSPSYKNTAGLGGEGSREEDEWIGFQKIKSAFLQGENAVAWISPPKIADYGFVFYFERNHDDPTKITEYVLQFDEQMDDVAKSSEILKKINPAANFQTGAEFLQNPVAINPANVPGILSAVGVSNNDIEKSLGFEEKIREELSPWVEDYIEAVFAQDIDAAKMHLTAIFNYASDIRKAIDELPGYTNRRNTLPSTVSESRANKEYLFAYYAKQEAKTAGGSCPVVNEGSDPFSPFNLMESIKSGKSINKTTEESSHFVCPKCDYHADGPVGDKCPGCGLTKNEYAEQGGAVC